MSIKKIEDLSEYSLLSLGDAYNTPIAVIPTDIEDEALEVLNSINFFDDVHYNFSTDIDKESCYKVNCDKNDLYQVVWKGRIIHAFCESSARYIIAALSSYEIQIERLQYGK